MAFVVDTTHYFSLHSSMSLTPADLLPVFGRIGVIFAHRTSVSCVSHGPTQSVAYSKSKQQFSVDRINIHETVVVRSKEEVRSK
jgi:hypothetical protein